MIGIGYLHVTLERTMLCIMVLVLACDAEAPTGSNTATTTATATTADDPMESEAADTGGPPALSSSSGGALPGTSSDDDGDSGSSDSGTTTGPPSLMGSCEDAGPEDAYVTCTIGQNCIDSVSCSIQGSSACFFDRVVAGQPTRIELSRSQGELHGHSWHHATFTFPGDGTALAEYDATESWTGHPDLPGGTNVFHAAPVHYALAPTEELVACLELGVTDAIGDCVLSYYGYSHLRMCRKVDTKTCEEAIMESGVCYQERLGERLLEVCDGPGACGGM